MALLAPEAVLANAFADWTESSDDLMDELGESGTAVVRDLSLQHARCFPGQDPNCSWTETHAMLTKMRGLRVVAEDGSKEIADSLTSIPNNVDMPTTKEIQERGKGDDVAKAITIIQTLWFAVQAAHRVSQGLLVTELELTTLAHVVLNIFIYLCWWNKPLNLRFPVDVYTGKRQEQPPNEKNAIEVESQRPTSPRKLPIRVRIGAYFNRKDKASGCQKTGTVFVCTCSIIGGMFGAKIGRAHV